MKLQFSFIALVGLSLLSPFSQAQLTPDESSQPVQSAPEDSATTNTPYYGVHPFLTAPSGTANFHLYGPGPVYANPPFWQAIPGMDNSLLNSYGSTLAPLSPELSSQDTISGSTSGSTSLPSEPATTSEDGSSQ